MNPLSLVFGREAWTIQVDLAKLLMPIRRVPLDAPIDDPHRSVKEALDHPAGQLGFPLRKAFTPEDRVAVVIDEGLPALGQLVRGVLEYLIVLGIHPDAVTLITPPGESQQQWIDELPDELADVRTEVHNPADRNRLSYLATTQKGRRIYLNRTLVDADQSIVLARRGYDALQGYSGGEATVYPALADKEIRRAVFDDYSPQSSERTKSSLRTEAREVIALLGSPILIQVVEGEGDHLSQVIAGLIDSSDRGIEALNDRFRLHIAETADIVIATLGGDPARQDFAAIARAAAVAAGVVKEDGCIVILTETEFRLSEAMEQLRQIDDPVEAERFLNEKKPPDYVALMQWVGAAQQTRLYLASGLQPGIVEELFATPIVSPGEVQRLVEGAERCLVLPDAHKCSVEVRQ